MCPHPRRDISTHTMDPWRVEISQLTMDPWCAWKLRKYAKRQFSVRICSPLEKNWHDFLIILASGYRRSLFECFFFAIFSYHQQNFEMIRYDLEKMKFNHSNMESACEFSPYILLDKQETLGNFLFECFLLLLANKWNS